MERNYENAEWVDDVIQLFCNLLGDRVQIAGHAALFLKGQIHI